MKKLFYLFFLLIFAVACKESPKQAKQTETPTPQPQPQVVLEKPYPSVPEETLQLLWEKCDYIDFIYYYHDFAMNQSDQPNIRGTLKHISAEVPGVDPSCQPIGRLFYQINGENALEGDLYMDNKCQYMIFYKEGQQAYANKLTPMGVKFYTQIFTNINKARQ